MYDEEGKEINLLELERRYREEEDGCLVVFLVMFLVMVLAVGIILGVLLSKVRW